MAGNYNNNNRMYNQNGYNGNRNYNNNGGNNNNNNQQEQRKKSGCKRGVGAVEKKPWISGWNKSSQGFMKFLAFPYSGEKSETHEVKSENGKIWQNWMARVTFPDRHTEIIPVMVEMQTGRVFFKDMNMIANPKAPNGGYWGRMVRRN